MTANDACRAIAPAAFRILGALVFAISPTWAGDRARTAGDVSDLDQLVWPVPQWSGVLEFWHMVLTALAGRPAVP